MRLLLFSMLVLATQGVLAQDKNPEKVYVQSSNSGGSSQENENCSYNNEHKHIHCYEDDSRNLNKPQTRVVYRTNSRTYRDRDDYASGLSTGALTVGLAVGIPLLLHNSYSYDDYSYGGYSHGYRSRYGHYRSYGDHGSYSGYRHGGYRSGGHRSYGGHNRGHGRSH